MSDASIPGTDPRSTAALPAHDEDNVLRALAAAEFVKDAAASLGLKPGTLRWRCMRSGSGALSSAYAAVVEKAALRVQQRIRKCRSCDSTMCPNADLVARGMGKFCSRKCYFAYLVSPERELSLFLSDVDKRGPVLVPGLGACWQWTGKRMPGKWNYGHAKWLQRHVRAHRWSWTLFRSDIPSGLSVLHKCDNPPCVNPDHLFLGTMQDNSDDMKAKGRQSRSHGKKGEAAGRAILCDASVLEIRRSFAAGGITQKELAKRFGTSRGAIKAVTERRTWTHLP